MRVDIPQSLMDEVISFSIAYGLDISFEAMDYTDMKGGVMACIVLSGGDIPGHLLEAMERDGFRAMTRPNETKFILGTMK